MNWECYYCDFKIEDKHEYEKHVVSEHFIRQPTMWKLKIGEGVVSVKYNVSVLAYPGLADLNDPAFKTQFPQAKPKNKVNQA